MDRRHELLDVLDALLQEVRAPGGAAFQERERIARLGVLAEHDDADVGRGSRAVAWRPGCPRRSARRHADVGDHDVGCSASTAARSESRSPHTAATSRSAASRAIAARPRGRGSGHPRGRGGSARRRSIRRCPHEPWTAKPCSHYMRIDHEHRARSSRVSARGSIGTIGKGGEGHETDGDLGCGVGLCVAACGGSDKHSAAVAGAATAGRHHTRSTRSRRRGTRPRRRTTST